MFMFRFVAINLLFQTAFMLQYFKNKTSIPALVMRDTLSKTIILVLTIHILVLTSERVQQRLEKTYSC